MATYYVDFGAANDGDGSTYTQASGAGQPGAFKTIVGKTFISGDTVWIRRSSTALALTATYNPTIPGVNLYGWPMAGDDHYANRPVGPQSVWDNDTAQYAKMQYNTANVSFAPSGNGTKYRRLWIDNLTTTQYSSSYYVLFGPTGSDMDIDQIRVTFSGIGVGGNFAHRNVVNISGANPTVKNLYARFCIRNDNTYQSYGMGINTGTTTGYFKNITLDVLSVYASSSIGPVLDIANTVNNKAVKIENLNINFLDPNPAFPYPASINISSGSVHINDVTINNAYNGISYQGPYIGVNGTNCRILNCKMASGAAGPISINNSNNCMVELKNWNILKQMQCSNLTILNSNGTGYPIQFITCQNCQVIINNGILNTTGPAYKPVYTDSHGVTAFLNNVQVPDPIQLTYRPYSYIDYDLYSANHDQVPGVWHYESRYARIDTSNVYRTGGGNYSFRGMGLDPNKGQNYREAMISPFTRETYFIDLAAGVNTITMYGAYVGWAGTNKPVPDNRDVGFMFDYIDNNNNYSAASTFDYTPLVADTSTWNNDTGLNPFRVTITITTNGPQTVPFHIFLSPEYDLTGYIYLDPIPVRS